MPFAAGIDRSVGRIAAAVAVLVAVSWADPAARAQQPPPVRSVDADSLAPPARAGEAWSLARCIATALERNGDVRVARARTRQASGSALAAWAGILPSVSRSEEHTSELQSRLHLVCRLLLEKK